MSIEEKQNQIVEDFSYFDDWEERYSYMIDLGKSLPMIAPDYKTEPHLIKGCQSQVWLHSELVDGKVIFTADSDAIITKGMIAILIKVFSGETPQAIAQANTDFVDKIGLKEHLSPTRANGLVSMIQQMKLYAQAFLTLKHS